MSGKWAVASVIIGKELTAVFAVLLRRLADALGVHEMAPWGAGTQAQSVQLVSYLMSNAITLFAVDSGNI